jgi:hypothetical protein
MTMIKPSLQPSATPESSGYTGLLSKCRILLLCALTLVASDNASPVAPTEAEIRQLKKQFHKALAIPINPAPRCEIYKETSFRSNRYMADYCAGGQERTQETNAEKGMNANYDKLIEDEADHNIHRLMQEEPEKPHSFAAKEFIPLKDIPAIYLNTLRDFDPQTFDELSGLVYVGDYPKPTGFALGPLNLIDGQLVESDEGKHAIVGVGVGQGFKFEEMDLEKILRENNKEQLLKFFDVSQVLAHEINGHVVHQNTKRHSDLSGKEMCKEDGLSRHVEGEIYGYYKGVQMVDYLVERYPAIKELLNQSMAIHERVRSKYEAATLARLPVILELEQKHKDGELPISPLLTDLYEAYKRAEQSGDWSEFKENILLARIDDQFGLTYFLSYLKNSELADECYFGLNTRIEAMLGSESPEELLKK